MSSNRKSTRVAARKASFAVTNLDSDYGYTPVVSEPKKRASKEKEVSSEEGVYEYRDPVDPTIELLYRPHSIAMLVILIAGLVVAAFKFTSPTDNLSNGLKGFGAAALAFIFLGLHQFGNGPFIRPHPAIWRFVLAVSIIYFVALIVLLFQNAETARRWMSLIDPALGVALPEKSYAEDCSLTWENVMDKMDLFVPAHLFGWMAKALILRDAWLCWIISVMFEVLEYTFEFQLPNFGECWWDHWILDVLLCNWAGIWLGMRVCDYFSMKTYHWRGIKDIPEMSGKVARSVAQFSPHSWTSFDWAATKTFKGYLVTFFLVFFFLLSEMNTFYLKALLWVPPPHWLNTARIVLVGATGMVAIRELYQYYTDPRCKKLGAQLWVALATIIVETLICIKFGKDELPRDVPKAVVYFWAVFTALLVLFPAYQFWWKPSRKPKEA